MRRLDSYRMRMVLIGLVAAIVICVGGNAKADFTFGEPVNLGPTVNSSAFESGMSISADGLSLFFSSERPGGYGGTDLWVTTRTTVTAPWGTPVNLGPTVNSSSLDAHPSITADGLSLFFSSGRSGGYGQRDIWVTTRPTVTAPWGTPVNLGSTVNSSYFDSDQRISGDGLSLYFTSNRPGGFGSTDIWVATRPTRDADWGTPVNLGPSVNSSLMDICPCISGDGLMFYFSSDRPGGFGSADLWVTTWATTDDPWGEPVNLGSTVNSSAWDDFPNVSADGATLYFRSNRSGGSGSWDLWQLSITPVVDLNGDGFVDSADMCIIVDHWGENYSLCDIGPTPLGDGIVDIEDLKVLAEHLFEDVSDLTLIAHWALDEAQGVIAYDSAADCDGTLIGGPVWQPDGGMVDGALQFDGIDDYVETGFVLTPADGVFSVVAWIKGGAPGQVVVSQAGAANWLCTDSVEGYLMTELKKGRFRGDPLSSEAFINDGNWHRIGFVWDGSCRYLYVDGVEVANDAEPLSGLNDAYGGLYLGVGSNLAQGTYFSGLIDEIRIYNRVVSP